ncbi:PAP2 superfamily protein [Phyllobacterium myrsinacearum]|uniref:phosphatase PAP2/dual specificity phosphatase family protein n=1 Tax=Phyllobacterium myrsinacearum TaxID=28101 RepID=UPI00102A55A3|nr:phosphatase PAP2/dual specificity phosphatase family protein [Phyllobacterium myrsinacearum]RZS77830.1 PAP2 superfamily protein [Phyllobacterium myrsinacearum]
MTEHTVTPIGQWRLNGAVAKRALIWLVCLAPLFYATYGTANWLASQRENVPNITFAWEHAIPFIAWTIFPYWSINLFYGLSLFFNDTTAEVDRLATRYLTAQTIAVTCFIAFPLTVVFHKPPTSGASGFLFDMLGGFDKPFNQAPSLHIALLAIIWTHWRVHLSGIVLWIWHLWCALIGISVLTTYQHHFIDIPTGLLLGLFALWLFPAHNPSPVAAFRLTGDRRARRIGACYAVAGTIFLLATIIGTPASAAFLFFLWPALALGIVSIGYFGAGPAIFQKCTDGTLSLASTWLLAPYRLGAILNSRIWTRHLPPSVAIGKNVYLGRLPRISELPKFKTVIDLTAELAKPSGVAIEWRSFPALDLVSPQHDELRNAADAIELARSKGPVLVCCALGFQRSAAAIAVWLLQYGDVKTAADAIRVIEAGGRRIHLTENMVLFAQETKLP